eukprot:1188700-Amphidinium_carterae.2
MEQARRTCCGAGPPSDEAADRRRNLSKGSRSLGTDCRNTSESSLGDRVTACAPQLFPPSR